jgi:hypothetical protein
VLGIYLLTTTSSPALWPTQSPIQWIQGALSVGANRTGREADRSPRSRIRAAIPLSPNTLSWRGAQLKHRDNFTFDLHFALGMDSVNRLFKYGFGCHVVF